MDISSGLFITFHMEEQVKINKKYTKMFVKIVL